jgi:MFS transporter, PAT family, beta-lactamase induction signal transducer AmpG
LHHDSRGCQGAAARSLLAAPGIRAGATGEKGEMTQAVANEIEPTATRALLGERRLWLMLAFGFVSGLPLYLSGFTLKQWLAEGGISLSAIGFAGYVGLAYTLKFLWAPVLDHLPPPGPFARFGRRRGWMLSVQPLLVLGCAGLALSNAPATPWAAVLAAGVIALASATQDIAIDAWRIETFPPRLQGAANSVYVWGYRVGMLVSGGGVLWGAGVLGWRGALLVIAGLAAAGMLVTLIAPEPALPGSFVRRSGGMAGFLAALADTLGEFLRRRGAVPILAFVALFHLGDGIASAFLAPFYLSLGFDRAAVAKATSIPSLAATIAGIGLGGWLVARVGIGRALLTTGLVQTALMTMYVALSLSPGSHAMLFATVMVEAFTHAVATSAFLAYLSTLCAVQHTATQFALMTSLAPLAGSLLGGAAGNVAESIGWTAYYGIATTAALPAMLLMVFILRRYPPPERAR